jgi:hypothetical protein
VLSPFDWEQDREFSIALLVPTVGGHNQCHKVRKRNKSHENFTGRIKTLFLHR